MTKSQTNHGTPPSNADNGHQRQTSRPARLTHLVLHGYKSFANKTELAFTSGITAVVGPNGSGKSNVADALRWVLGEQSFAALRGKRTEDMIFSGSEQRARMGMASVTVTFDNSDGWLPVDFQTVQIMRRAYRSGENEYYLNGTRVRLRDIHDILAASGLARRSYAIIGQGLIDQALSLRHEERRLLLEEAAGITAYQRKRDQALNRLEEVQTNLVRVRDIIAEITPRLRRLQRQAERARQHTLLQDNLKSLLTTWYGYQWHIGIQRLEEAKEAQAMQEAHLEERRRRIQDLEERLQALREDQANLRTKIEEGHRNIAVLHREVEALTREEAVVSERQRGLAAQRESLLSEVAPLQAHLQVLQERLQDAQSQYGAVQEEEQRLEHDLVTAQGAVAAILERRRQAEEVVHGARQRLLQLTTRLAQLQEQRHQVEERLTTLAQDIATQEARLGELTTALDSARADLVAHQERLQALTGEEARLAEAHREQEGTVEDARRGLEKARDAERQARQALHTLQERFNLLERLREEGTGLYAGVKAVMQAAHRGRLSGIVGVVAELVQVPPHLERAVEEALGGSLQDVVVERWQDAEAAIAFLKEERRGRATFLPLDTLRPPRRVSPGQGAGILGIAADLVRTEPRLEPVVELLLNRTLVVEQLATARRTLSQSAGMRIVTVAGELVRSSGRVTGGRRKSREGGMLAREREWRDLPGRIKKAEQQVQEAQERVAQRQELLTQARARLGELAAERHRLQEKIAHEQREERRLESALAQLEGKVRAQREQHARLQQEAERLQAQRRSLQEPESNVLAEKEAVAAALEEAQAHVDAVDDTEARERLAHLEAMRATVVGRRQSLDELTRALSADIQQQEALIRNRREQAAALQVQEQELATRLTALRERLATVQARLDDLSRPVKEAEQRRQTLREDIVRLERELEQERRRLHQQESHLGQMTLAVQRAQDALARLRQQVEEDFGLVVLEEQTDALPSQIPLPLGNGVVTFPKVMQVPAGLEEEIRRLRIQIRNLGHINPDAPQEYEQLRERYDFLQEQVADLTRASADLKEALAELERIMEEEFKRTFRAVARHFKVYFERLFGGGTARLVLTNPDDLSTTGIDIVVRPPGKRTQNLSMLSGGERALTSAALIFSILRVSPTPFCVLDEVDAALDEANVARFREALRELANDIQFVVITHNRGTMEVVDTIYGISMAKDGVSQALSLRLEEVEKHTA